MKNQPGKTGIAVRHIERTDTSTIDSLARLGSATVHEAQGRIGNLDPALRPVFNGPQIAGSAITVLLQPGDNWMLHVALELCLPGDVLIAASQSPSTDGYFGDLLATSAIAHGVKGLVIDGGCRDIAELQALDFPVWSRAVSIRGTVKNTLGSVNVPLVCAGQLVTPGDVVVADDDGVCIVSREHAQTVLVAAEKRAQNEIEKRQQFAAGMSGLDLYDMRHRLAGAGFKYVDKAEDVE